MAKTQATKTATTPNSTRRTSKAAREAHAALQTAQADALDIAAVHLPSAEQVEAEAAAAQAEEAANLAAEAAAQAEEAATTSHDGYSGPMLALRERAKRGLYAKQANGQPACGDEIAALLGVLPPALVIRACISAMALPGNPYLHLNIGQQSMNLRNKLRGAMKRGEFGMGVVREAVEEEQDKLADQLKAAAAAIAA